MPIHACPRLCMHVFDVSVCVCVYMPVGVRTCLYIFIYVYICLHIPIHMWSYMSTYVHMCLYAHIGIYIGVSTAIHLCCTCYIAITAQPRLCKDKLSQQKHADGNTHKVLGSIMHSYVEAVQPVYTLYSNHCVSTVAYANRAFRSLAIQVLVSFGESPGIHFGEHFVTFLCFGVPK